MKSNVVQLAKSKVNQFDLILDDFVKKLTIKDVSKRTIEAYCLAVAKISLFFNQSPLTLNDKQLNEYLFKLKTQNSSKSAFKLAIYALRSLFELNNLKKLKTKLPAIKQEKRMPVVLSVEECKDLIKAPLKFKDRFLIAFLYSSGLRVFELSNLKIADVDAQRLQIHVYRGKGNKDRYVPLSKYIANSLPKYLSQLNPQIYLFNATKNHKQLTVKGIQQIIYNAALKSKMIKHVSAHILRHTYATHLLENGVDLLTIKNVMGHERIETTMIYLHVAKPLAPEFKNPLDVLFNQ